MSQRISQRGQSVGSGKLKVVTFIGTRPEIIRLSETIKLLDRFVNHILVHTGQNYDYELNEIFFEDLGLRKPDRFLNVDVSSLGASVGDIIRKSEQVLREENPDAVLVLGDTNSCLSAYMAKRMHIPIYHMEAGNRCFDENVPEETNRRIIDHIADFNLVYTEHARRHLLSEGLPHRRIYLTGSPMREVIEANRAKIQSSRVLKKLSLSKGKYFVVSVHREENVDSEPNLKAIIDVLNALAREYRLRVVVSTHPRTRKRIDEMQGLKIEKNVNFLKPFGFSDYIKLQTNAKCTISDSGTISEESAILNFPAITIRNSMERPEAMDAGTIVLSGLSKDVVLNSVAIAAREWKERSSHGVPAEYGIRDTSWRVAKLIMGTSKLSNEWSAIRS